MAAPILSFISPQAWLTPPGQPTWEPATHRCRAITRAIRPRPWGVGSLGQREYRCREGDGDLTGWEKAPLGSDVSARTGLKGGDGVGPGGLDCPGETPRAPNRSDCRSNGVRRGRWMTGMGCCGRRSRAGGGRRPWKEQSWLLAHGGVATLRCTFSLCKPPRWISGPRSPTGHVQMLVPSHGPTSGRCMSVPLWPHWGVTPASSRVWSVELVWGLLPALLVSTPLPTLSGPGGPRASQTLREGELSPCGLDAAPSCWSGCPQEPSSPSGTGPQGPLGEGGLCRDFYPPKALC